MTNRIDGNLHVTGTLKVGSMDLPAAAVTDDNMDPANPIDVDKQIHQYVHTYAQNRAAAVAAERKAVFSATGDGALVNVQAGVTQAAVGDSTITVDVYKNGVSVLTGVLTIDSGDAAFATQTAVVTPGSEGYSAGQVFEVVIAVTAGTGTLPRGVYVSLTVNEEAS